jgi:GntR family transcriptional regulator/MocR family aminotransferase
MGVPAQDAFPGALWSRILTREARRSGRRPGRLSGSARRPGLAQGVAAYLGIARGLRCSPSQVLITAGFSGALGIAIRGSGWKAGRHGWKIRVFRSPAPRWPGRHDPAAVPVDAEGLDVAAGIAHGAGRARSPS